MVDPIVPFLHCRFLISSRQGRAYCVPVMANQKPVEWVSSLLGRFEEQVCYYNIYLDSLNVYVFFVYCFNSYLIEVVLKPVMVDLILNKSKKLL